MDRLYPDANPQPDDKYGAQRDQQEEPPGPPERRRDGELDPGFAGQPAAVFVEGAYPEGVPAGVEVGIGRGPFAADEVPFFVEAF